MKTFFLFVVAIVNTILTGGCVSNPFIQKDIVLYNQGVELVKADKDLDAAEMFKKVLEINPKHPLAHYNLGVIYDECGMFEEAIAQFRLALEINPKNIDAHYRLGIAYATQGMDEDAIAQLQSVLQVEPSHIPTYYNLAVLYEGLGQQDRAIEYYRKVIELKPDYPEALNNLGLAYAKKGMLDAAEEHLHKAIGARPNYFEALNNLGVVLVQKHRYEKAASAFQRAMKQNPKSAKTLYNLAKISYENIHDQRAALEYAQTYLNLVGYLEKKKEMEDLSASVRKELDVLQRQADTSVEGRIRNDAKDFILAVQRADFRDFYLFQPPELRDTLSKERWDLDLSGMDPIKLAEQKEALVKLIGFEDLLSVQIKTIELVSVRKAKVVLANHFAKEGEITQKEAYWEEVNGRWAPSDFLQRIKDNWDRARIDSTAKTLGD